MILLSPPIGANAQSPKETTGNHQAYYIDPVIYLHKRLPRLVVKADLMYGLSTLTPNLSGEIGLGRRTTLELGGSNNRWHRQGSKSGNKKFVHWTVRPEFRYWMCERFNGHYFGINATYWQYNVSSHNLLWMFDKKYRYNGHAVRGGITYGYHMLLGKRWNAEFTAGFGVAVMNHNKLDCHYCGLPLRHESKVYFGPTRLGISLVYIIK